MRKLLRVKRFYLGRWRMLKRAFSTSQHSSNTFRWKTRLCFGFGLVLVLSLGVIFFAWNMICGIPSSAPEIETVRVSMHNMSGPVTKHRVELYYEVLCPDSRFFFLKQFQPAFAKLKDYIIPVMVPYGKATMMMDRGKLRIDCQHGVAECQGNTIHACAAQYIQDETLMLDYLGCMINNNRNPESVGIKCARELRIDWSPIEACFKGNEGLQLHKKYGDMTNALSPAVSFIPTIVINKSQEGQLEILKNFLAFMCQNVIPGEERPSACF